MSIETTYLTEARCDTDHGTGDLMRMLERPLRRASLNNATRRIVSRMDDERACFDAEIRRQQKQIAKLRNLMQAYHRALEERDQRIETYERQAIVERLIEEQPDNITDLAAD
jgi:epoxyqueuosine reductase QueG